MLQEKKCSPILKLKNGGCLKLGYNESYESLSLPIFTPNFKNNMICILQKLFHSLVHIFLIVCV